MNIEFIYTPDRLYRIEKLKRKAWSAHSYIGKVESKATPENGIVLGVFPSKLVALAAVAVDVDTNTRKKES